MRKGKKRPSKAASVNDSSSSDDESLVKNKKARNEAGKKDGAYDSDENHKNGEETDKKSKSKSRQNDKRSHEQNDDKKKKKNRNREESEDEDENKSASDDEALSKIVTTTKPSKKSDASSAKSKGKQKEEQDDPLDADIDEEYEVEEIISHKHSHGKILYLIRWKGYEADADTWEKPDTLENCPEILKKYTDEHPDSIAPTSASKSSKSNKKDKKRKKHKEIVVEEFDETKDYEVEKILDVFFKKDKTREFLVRWKGYQSSSDSWEPEEHLNCPDLIQRYMAKVEVARNLLEKELRPHRKHTERFTLRTQESERRLSKRHTGKQRAVYYDADD